MRDLVDTTEMYLRTIYELEEENIVPLRARIVERLEQSGPTVSQTVARMERDELLHVRPDRTIELTEKGRRKAVAVMRKHRLAERLLTDVLKVDITKVHDEACRWEHVMSDEVELNVINVLGEDAARSPFGNPVPGLDELDTDVAETAEHIGLRAYDLPDSQPRRARITQINEVLQVNGIYLRDFQRADIDLGSEVVIVNHGGLVTLTNGDRSVEIPSELSHALRVELID
ncbi:metal-dependent transcriptional regulator [Corynebacterium otitidis]|uniref:Diphtheria toxin repressor n=1 Tax=Corynebacterium otitidis ATCC 51513 TaxID=883169 RepID=I7L8E4_9CORY|nr:metal-dependent transcriptional regulator [Corynebacterium otitidis]EJZ83051.1 hypothetical protein HMPREF9719_00046 [Corynebacterium otitidis ATCC 51513]KKO82989.1 toxin repressor [Corynebacterium otitidis]CCI83177.1 Diphtheria toxin repressor [Corynebacterium otitidis ATCC 51513]